MRYLDLLLNYIQLQKSSFLASLSLFFSIICKHLLSKFSDKSVQKFSFFSNKANYVRGLLNFLLILFLSASCSLPKQEPEKKPLVVTSVAPYLHFVLALAGDLVEAKTLVVATADPHLFETTPRQISALSDTDLFIGIGELFEAKVIAALKKTSPHIRVLDLGEQLPPLPHDSPYTITGTGHKGCGCGHQHEDSPSADRHYWLSLSNNILTLELLGYHLTELLPDHRSLILERKEELIRKIHLLDHQIYQQLQNSTGDAFLTSHAAFGYFCQNYHIYQIAIEAEGREALLQELGKLTKVAQQKHACVAISQPQHSNKGLVTLAEQLNLPVIELNPYGQDPLATISSLATILKTHCTVPHDINE